MTKASKKSKQRGNQPRTRVAVNKGERATGASGGENSAAAGQGAVCAKCGMKHYRCSGHTRNGPNAGKPCGARPPRGQTVCIKHGGNRPEIRKAAKQRLLELVDPALAELQRIVTDPTTDDSVKLKSIVAVLDRTGFARGVQISVETRAWDEAVVDALDLDRSGIEPGYGKAAIGGGGGDQAELELEQRAYNAKQLAADAREEAWAETGWDAEDAPPDHPYRDERTVKGEVVGESILPTPPNASGPSDMDPRPYRSAPEPRTPTDPPRYEQEGERIPPGYYWDEEVRRAERGPRRRR